MVAILHFKFSLHFLGMGRKQAGFAHVLRVQCTCYIRCKVNPHALPTCCGHSEDQA